MRDIRFESVPSDLNSSFVFRDCYHKRINVNWHHHPELELVHVTEGNGLRFVGDSIGSYNTGDVLFYGSNMPHAWHAHPNRDGKQTSLLIQFSPQFMGREFLSKPELRRVLKFFESARRGFNVTGRTRQRVIAQLDAMRKAHPGSLERLCGLLSILAMLSRSRECRAISTARIEPVLNQSAHRKISTVIKYISENLAEMPSQTMAAKSIHMSPVTFSRFFKRCVGKTYIDYVTSLRIGLACRELIETDKSITEIAYNSGFNTLSNFNRLFLKLKRLTPLAFRRTMSIS